jgi:hypothetical protein
MAKQSSALFMGSVKRNMAVDPPQFSLRPWYHITLNFPIQNSGVEERYTPTAIAQGICTQLGLSIQNSTKLNMRFKSVELWSPAVGSDQDRPSANLLVSSLVPSIDALATPTAPVGVVYSTLVRLGDVGSLNAPAKCGYHWPLSQRSLAISGASTFTVCETSKSGGAFASLRIHLDWCSTDIADPIG